MNQLDKHQVSIAFEKIALMAAHSSSMVNMIFEDEGDINRNAQILGAVEVMFQQAGIIADMCAARLGGSCVKNGVEGWVMPPIYNIQQD